MAAHLDDEVIDLLSRMDSFFIQQRVRMIEAVTQGCFEQANIYDVFDHDKKRIMIIKEESDAMSRCCCAPGHSVFVKFYLVGKDAPELIPGQKVDWSYDPADKESPFMTFEREGCDCCCTGPCPKPCLFCFACSDGCLEKGELHAGDMVGKPGEKKGQREKAKLLGQSVQPPGGGGFKPLMQIMERGDGDDATGKTNLFAASRGPCITGGCSKFCLEAIFGVATADPSMENNSRELHKQNFGDIVTLEKTTPKNFGQAMREAFTDSDLFDVQFTSKTVTPQQKANVLAHMIHLDYMFFERDNDMCFFAWWNGTLRITFCNCFIYGCVCPCFLDIRLCNYNLFGWNPHTGFRTP